MCVKYVVPILTRGSDLDETDYCWTFLSGQCMNQTSYPRLLLGMNLGVFVYDPQMKCQSFKWYTKISLGKKNFWVIESELNVFLIAFFNSLGMVCHKFAPLGHSEAFSWCHLVEETGKWCTLAHPASSTAGFDEEPNLNHPPATVFS